MQKKINLVVFDFDGTLSARDTNAEFVKYCFAHSLRPWIFLPIVLFGFALRYLNKNGLWWRGMARRYLTPKLIARLAPGFIKQHRKNRFKWAAERVAAERAAGNRVILISAGSDFLIPKLVSDLKFDAVICSITDAAAPWRLKFFCYAENKVVAMDNYAKKHKFFPNLVRAYGDSPADRFIMELADDAVWIDAKDF